MSPKERGNREQQSASGKWARADQRQVDRRHFRSSDQIGAQEHAHVSAQDEIVVFVGPLHVIYLYYSMYYNCYLDTFASLFPPRNIGAVSTGGLVKYLP